jgi:hypothetical protein
MILPILLFAALLLVGGILAGAGASRRPQLGNGWRTALVMFGTVTGGVLGAIGLTAGVLALLYLGAG